MSAPVVMLLVLAAFGFTFVGLLIGLIWALVARTGEARSRLLVRFLFGFGLWFAAVVAGVFALVIVAASMDRRSVARSTSAANTGQEAPDFEFHPLEGSPRRLSDLRGKPVVLNFFATWCGPCMMEMPHLEKDLWKPLKKEGFVLVAVGREHSETEVKAFRDKNQFTFTFAADPKREIFGKFAKQSIPRCVLIGKDGHIKFQSIGYAEKEFDTLVQAVKAELSGSQR